MRCAAPSKTTTPDITTTAELTAALDGEHHAEKMMVESVSATWSSLIASAFEGVQDYETLWRLLPQDDPAKEPIGLLDLVGGARWETMHTAAIARMIDPRQCPAINEALLGAFIQCVSKSVLKLADYPSLSEAKIYCEESYDLGAEADHSEMQGRIGILDLRIELGKLVLVVENKIGAKDREAQLRSYEHAVRAKHGRSKLFFVYLTPTGASPTQPNTKNWNACSYGDVALAWRSVLREHSLCGIHWPSSYRAYLSTVIREICGWRMHTLPRNPYVRAQHLNYLRVAVG